MEVKERNNQAVLKSDVILTPAETEVAICYTTGLVGKQIATKLGISYNTVVKHTQNIYDKTGIQRSTNALVSWFLSLNFDIDIHKLEQSVFCSIEGYEK